MGYVFAANGVKMQAVTVRKNTIMDEIAVRNEIDNIHDFADKLSEVENGGFFSGTFSIDVNNFEKILDMNPQLRGNISRLDPNGDGKNISEKALMALASTYKDSSRDIPGLTGRLDKSRGPLLILSLRDIWEFANKKLKTPKELRDQIILPKEFEQNKQVKHKQ